MENRPAGENVQVIVRCRPINEREQKDGQTQLVKSLDKNRQIVVQLKFPKTRESSRTYNFDAVFGPQATQKELFVNSISPIVEEVLNGYNCTIFAYGTTGTGKTFTMEGPRGNLDYSGNISANQKIKMEREAGIISRSVHQIFDELEKNGLEYSVRVSHLELYNEDLYDLLNPLNENLRLMEDPKNGIQITNLEEMPVSNPKEIFSILERSWEERRTAETNLNKHSSRSHCIFSITILIKETTVNGEDLIKVGKLNLVDLAGSENINRSGADLHYARKQEASKINKSLLTLGRVITALTEGAPHVPYRESKLTRLLRDSLGGKTKTCIIATISPASGSLEETMSTLEYAFRAKNIKNRPEINQKMAKREVIKEYINEINTLRAQIECMRSKTGVYLPLEQYSKMEDEMKQSRSKVVHLEESIEKKIKEFEELQESFDQQEQVLGSTEKVLSTTKAQLADTESELKDVRSALVEQKYLTEEHVRTESVFHSQADILMKTLTVLNDDIGVLFDKIGKLEEIGDCNVECVMRFRRECTERLRRDIAKCVSFVEETKRRLSLINPLNIAVEDRMVFDRVRGMIGAIESEITTKLSELYSISQSGCDELIECVRSMLCKNEDNGSELESVLSRQRDEIRQGVDMMKGRFNEMLESGNAWCRSRLENLGAYRGVFEEYVNEGYEGLNGVECESLRYLARNLSYLDGQKASLTEFLRDQDLLFEQFKSDLMKEFSARLEEFGRVGRQRSLSFMERFYCDLQCAVNETRSFETFSKDYVGRRRDELKAWGSRTNEFLKQGNESLVGHDEACSEFIKSFNEGMDCLSSLNDEYKEHQSGRIASYRLDMKELGARCDERVRVHREAIGERIWSIGAKDSAMNGEVLAMIADRMVGLDRDEVEHRGCVEGLVDLTGSFGSSSVADAESIVEMVNSLNLKGYASSDLTPHKRVINYPRRLARTRRHEVILNEFRSHLARMEQGIESEDSENLTSLGAKGGEKGAFTSNDNQANGGRSRVHSKSSNLGVGKAPLNLNGKKPSPSKVVGGKTIRLSNVSNSLDKSLNCGKRLQEITNGNSI